MGVVFNCIAGAAGVVMFLLWYFSSKEPVDFVISGVWLGVASCYIAIAFKELFDIINERLKENRAKKLKKARAEAYKATVQIMCAASGKICDICPLKEKCTKGQGSICLLGSALQEATEEIIEKIYADKEDEG